MTLASWTLPVVTPAVWTSPLLLSTPMCAFMPKYHWLPFFDWLISGSRQPFLFFVEGDAAINVASMVVPPRSSAPLSSRRADRLEDRFGQVVRFEQMAEVEDRRLVRDRIVAEFQSGKRPHRLDVVKRLLGAWIGQLIPL